MVDGNRVIDIGGIVEPEEDYEGEVLVVFSIDPGVATGWSAWKVPVRLLGSAGVGRTLVRCRHRHGTVLRSGARLPSPAGGAWDSTDHGHVSTVLDVARGIHEEWMPDTECACEEEEGDNEECPEHGGDEFVPWPAEYVFVMEGFDLRRSEMDPSLLSPVRVASIIQDRLWVAKSAVPMFFQKVSDAKHTITDTRLKGWGIYDSGSGNHARDADRHAILFLRRFASELAIRERVFGYDPLDESQWT